MELNRRSFLKVAGAGAAAAMAAAGATVALADAPAPAAGPAAGFVPGTYTGTGKGISSDVTVTVTVDETSVTDVAVDASGETANIGAAAADELQYLIAVIQHFSDILIHRCHLLQIFISSTAVTLSGAPR